MARVLGLDLGSYSVKAVLFESSLRGYQTRGFTEVRRAEGERMQTLRAALAELFQSNPMFAEQVVVALPGPSLATHVIQMPFLDAKRLEAALPFELESQLPFDLGEAVFDYQVACQREKQSELLVGVVRKEELRALLTVLKDANIDPRIVTHPAMAYQSLFLSCPQLFEGASDASSIAVVDIGHERTSIAIGRPSIGVELARTFSSGGKDLTKALASEFQADATAAGEWKETQGAMGSVPQTEDAKRAAAAMVRGLQPVLRELRPSIKAFTARTRRSVSQVYLCGGSAQLPGMEEEMSNGLSLPARMLALPTEAGEIIASAKHSEAVQAFALALRGHASSSRAQRLNFRRGEFAFKGDFDYVREKVGLLASLAATLLILLIASGIVRNSVLSRREQQVDAVLCSVTQRVLGQCEKNFDRALNLLRGKESPAALIPRVSAVSMLGELTQRVPAEVPVTFDQIIIEPDRMSVRGETDSPKSIDQITGGLKTYRCFREVKEGKIQKSKDGQHVNFTLDVLVECPDQAAVPQG